MQLCQNWWNWNKKKKKTIILGTYQMQSYNNNFSFKYWENYIWKSVCDWLVGIFVMLLGRLINPTSPHIPWILLSLCNYVRISQYSTCMQHACTIAHDIYPFENKKDKKKRKKRGDETLHMIMTPLLHKHVFVLDLAPYLF